MKSWLVVVQWMVLATAMAAPQGAEAASSAGQTNTLPRRASAKPPRAPAGNRFLFILETSAAMATLEHGGRQAIFDLIYSAVDGRMRNGDTYGIWTFNELPSVGFYPMQTWDAQRNLEHASTAGRFLKMQKYEKDGNLTNLLKQVQAVLRVAQDLNVFIVTDGNTPASGTPFDAEINAQYQANAPQLRETKRPLITILTARGGKLTAGCVTVAGEKIVLAGLPLPTNDLAKVGVVSAPANATATNEPPALVTSPEKPLGQVVAITDADAETGPAKLTNALRQAAASEKIQPVFAVHTNDAPPVTADTANATNVAEQPVVPSPPPSPATRPDPIATATQEPTPKVSARVLRTNEALPHAPEPLPAMVPAQIKVSARVAGNQPVPRPSLFPANLMLILGGAFVGASLVGGLIFVRRVREPQQPSFISQGMQRK
jgi:hypothetical protein